MANWFGLTRATLRGLFGGPAAQNCLRPFHPSFFQRAFASLLSVNPLFVHFLHALNHGYLSLRNKHKHKLEYGEKGWQLMKWNRICRREKMRKNFQCSFLTISIALILLQLYLHIYHNASKVSRNKFVTRNVGKCSETEKMRYFRISRSWLQL